MASAAAAIIEPNQRNVISLPVLPLIVALRSLPALPGEPRQSLTRRASGIPLSASFASRCRAAVSLDTGPSLTRYRALPFTLTAPPRY